MFLGSIECFLVEFAISSATLNIVGDFSEEQVSALFGNLTTLQKDPIPPITKPTLAKVDSTQIYFYNVPEAKQSVLRLRRPALAVSDPNYAKLEALNFPLGGIYTSKLMTELRVNKGFTYSIRSFVFGDASQGQFGVNTSVRTNATLESLALINQIMSDYTKELSAQELAQTKDALLRGQALKNETLGDKLSLVQNISRYGLPDDAQSRNMENIQKMDLASAKAIIGEHIKPRAMRIVVVGDAKSQLGRLTDLGFGEPILLNPQ